MRTKIPTYYHIGIYGALFLWMGVIFYLSSLQGDGRVYEMPKTMFLERKAAHVGEYFVLMLLFLRLFSWYLPRNLVRTIFLAGFLTITYAVSDEIHQLFVFGRTGKITDVGIDGIGVLCAGLLWLVYARQRGQKQQTQQVRRTKAKTLSKKAVPKKHLLQQKKKPTMKGRK